MYKTIKIPEGAYNEAKILSRELEKSKAITGVFNVNLSTAISFAITKMLDSIRKKKRFISSADGWKDIKDIEKIKDEIYASRRVSKRREVTL